MTAPRLPALGPDDVEGEARAIFDAYLKERGNIPNMFRTVAHRPKHLATMIAHFRTVMGEGTVPPQLKELLSVRVSHLNHCRYWLASHTALARRLGATDAMVRGVRSDGTAGLEQFEPAWRVALQYADAVTDSGHAVTDELYAELARHWDAGQIVEITQVIGLFAYFNRFNDALRVEVTR